MRQPPDARSGSPVPDASGGVPGGAGSAPGGRGRGLVSRLLALALGILATFLLLEGGLWLVGEGFWALQAHRNRTPSGGGGRVIVCIGESTTALGGDVSYPAQLQGILDRRTTPGAWAVVNAAMPGAWSGQLVDRLEKDLDRFAPDVVVAMMGANDYAIPLADPRIPRGERTVWSRFRTIRLARMARWQILHPERGATGDDPAEGVQIRGSWLRDRVLAAPGDGPLHFHYGWQLLEEGRLEAALHEFRASATLAPRDAESALMVGYCLDHLGLTSHADGWYERARVLGAGANIVGGMASRPGWSSRDLAEFALNLPVRAAGDLAQALVAAEVATSRLPDDPRSWTALARAADAAGQEARAIDAWWKVAALAPGDPAPRLGIARILARSDPAAAEVEVAAVLVDHPTSPDALTLRGRLLWEAGHRDEAEAATREAIAGTPSVDALLQLAEILEAADRQADAEACLQQAIALDTGCNALEKQATHLASRGRRAEAAALLDRVEATDPTLRACRDALSHVVVEGDFAARAAPRLRQSYARLVQLLEPRGISLVAVQYPTLPVSDLRRVLPEGSDIRVVDNEAAFKDAVRRYGYAGVFTDRGYGTFGHGTGRGNGLLAERVADAILEVDGGE